MAPYASDSQRRFFHSPGAKKAGITKGQVNEYDSASKGMKLPEKKSKVISNLEKTLGSRAQ